MKYVIKVNDKEYGPVAENVLFEWVEDGRVLFDTPLRNSMMRIWRNAGDLPFLKEAFENQGKKFDANAKEPASYVDNMTHVRKIKNPVFVEGKKEEKRETEFKNTLLCERANISLRVKAGIIDFIIVVLIFILTLFVGTYFISSYGTDPGFTAYIAIVSWFFLTLLYFSGCIGVFAQTLGMWLYGIILVRIGDDVGEVYLLRAYVYALLILVVGIFSPIFNFIGGKKRALHDFLTDTQVVKISARKIG